MTPASKYIIQAMKDMSIEQFKTVVSRKQLEQCLLDKDLDSDDVLAIKEMLKDLYNYERSIN